MYSNDRAKLVDKWNDFADEFRMGLSKDEDGNVILDNKRIDSASDDFDKLEAYGRELAKSKWGDKVNKFVEDIQKTEEFETLKWSYVSYMSWSNAKRPAERAMA